jgi:hypothetical protein
VNIEHSDARDVLEKTFADVARDYIEGRMPRIQSILEKSYDLLFESKTQAYREVLLGCILARLLNLKVDVRLPYVQQGEFAYSGRTLDEKVINPFLHKAKIPSSKGPFLSVFRRSVTLTEDTRAGLRDQKGFDAMLKVLGFVNDAGKQKLHEILRYHLYRFILLRETSQIELIRPKRLSLPQFERIISSLIETASGGRFPVFLVVATFAAIRERFGLNWDIQVQGINVADSASGAGGDVVVVEEGHIVLAAEVTERRVDKSRVVATFDTKIAPCGIEDYLFVVKDDDNLIDVMDQAKRYFSQGYEVNFVEIKCWICAVLTVLGAKGRTTFLDELTNNLSAEGIPAALKQAWNDAVLQLTSDEVST